MVWIFEKGKNMSKYSFLTKLWPTKDEKEQRKAKIDIKHENYTNILSI